MMKKKSFFNRMTPAITYLTSGASIDELAAGIKKAYYSGADGMAVELLALPPEERTIDNYQKLMKVAPVPYMFILYRNDKWHGDDDEARQKYLLDAVEAGCEVVDVMGDLYQPSPRELATDPAAIEKQKKLIDKIHDAGGKVVMSSHTQDFLSGDEVLAHMRTQSERGADILKLVSACRTEEELSSQIATTMRLNRELDKPFIHLSNGAFNRPHRFLSPVLGSSVAFAKNDLGQMQPSFQEFQEFMGSLKWHIDDVQNI